MATERRLHREDVKRLLSARLTEGQVYVEHDFRRAAFVAFWVRNGVQAASVRTHHELWCLETFDDKVLNAWAEAFAEGLRQSMGTAELYREEPRPITEQDLKCRELLGMLDATRELLPPEMMLEIYRRLSKETEFKEAVDLRTIDLDPALDLLRRLVEEAGKKIRKDAL